MTERLKMLEDNGCGLKALYVKAEKIVSQQRKSFRSNKVAEPGKKTGKACQKAEKPPFYGFRNKGCERRKYSRTTVLLPIGY